ncbi:hypothetical protein LIER_01862 [Lithospermum erythrorhizon]|uniref:Bidirectional sugar transporter SWEET n=1 Tax=Lithospermum erythrorhizon TaxID=34254 RepID=A0AAV3NNR3_LITER
MAYLTASEMAFVCGILGNIVSFGVFLAPLPTFYRMYKKKSTEGFQSIPYSVALFSAMLYLYYAYLKKKDALMLITINSFGTVIETIYLIIFMIYATRKAKIYTTKLLILFNFGALGLIIVTTYLLAHGNKRIAVVGWICAVFSVSVFAAPLSIMVRVIKTKSVEYLPINLSVCLTLCAVMWFLYGLLIKDYYIASPNILGFTFGIVQMILYAMFRKGPKQEVIPEENVKQFETVIDMTTLDNKKQEAHQDSSETAQVVATKKENISTTKQPNASDGA